MIYSLYRKIKTNMQIAALLFHSVLLSHVGYIQTNLIIRQRISEKKKKKKKGILLAFPSLTFCKRTSTTLVF